MKERLLKRGVVLFLVAVLVVGGVLASHPVTSQAAAKGTTYTVVVQKGSPQVSLVSINYGTAVPQISQNEGMSFQILVDSKAKNEKVKSTGGTASYYPVTILAKSFKAPTSRVPMMGGGGYAITSLSMPKDSKGKLYISGGDVDVSAVQGEKKATFKIGDGTVDAGALIIPINILMSIKMEDTGKQWMTTLTGGYWTTGKSYIIVKGTKKSKLEGKAQPDNDTSNNLPKPLVGAPVDLAAGTGTLVNVNGLLNTKNKQIGMLDYLNGGVWVMKITK
jgi:hypothetical protein